MTRVALYARVSTLNQVHQQTIDQQLDRLRTHLQAQGLALDDRLIFRDDGHSGARLNRPGLDGLRDAVRERVVDRVVMTSPDRLARNYVHQMLLLEEFERQGCQVEFLDRPMSRDPHDQLLLQIRGAVAEYERTLIAERMRRGRQARLRAGVLLPWTRAPYGYRLHPDRPRDPSGVVLEPGEASVVADIFSFSDFKGRGFELENSQLEHADRLERLILVMSLAMGWCVQVRRDDALNRPTPLEKKRGCKPKPDTGASGSSAAAWFPGSPGVCAT